MSAWIGIGIGIGIGMCIGPRRKWESERLNLENAPTAFEEGGRGNKWAHQEWELGIEVRQG